ncbi:VOC family protein [Micrococcus terreus]|uniref:VOC family protein n=1 Tax=Micrococcus terreus TaxID=574650 RepID=UPI00254CB259|nr:VOC family protein [Micrococcus terreus]MDK7701098.1 VOC family protein [Micrococcus terreus]WOO96856.1 VOC family protein [Micrococcus terreus]
MMGASERAVRGIPGIRGTDHIGFTVPDLEEAHEFLVEVIGCDYIYSLGPYPADPELMQRRLNVHPQARMRELRFYRCFNGTNFEVFHYESPDQRTIVPKNTDVGGHHVALYVDDIDAAVRYLDAQGVQVLGAPTSSSGDSAGQRWVYFLSPWGMQFELVSFPQGKAYEGRAEILLWRP